MMVTPTPAERARTVLSSATSVRLGILSLAQDVDGHLVAPDGSVWLQPSAESPARVLALARGMAPWTATATALDVASVPQADRVRARLTLTGPVEAVPDPLARQVRARLDGRHPEISDPSAPILRMSPTRVVLEWFCHDGGDIGTARSANIPCAAYRAACPDPFVDCEGAWLTHLHRQHPTALRRLAEQALGGLDDDAEARPLLVDRHGLVLRIHRPRSAGAPVDVRLPFARRVTCACEGTEALDDLWRRAGLGAALD